MLKKSHYNSGVAKPIVVYAVLMPILPRKNCPTLTIAIYQLKSWTWVLIQFWNLEIISINKKVTASQSEIVSFFGQCQNFFKLRVSILVTLRGSNQKMTFLTLICMTQVYNILNLSWVYFLLFIWWASWFEMTLILSSVR